MPSRGGGPVVPGTIKEPHTNAGKCERFGTFVEYSFTLTTADAEDMSHEGGGGCGCRPGKDLSGVPQLIPRAYCFDSHNSMFSRTPEILIVS